MSTILKTMGRALILENVTHAQINADTTILYPAGFYAIRVSGEEAQKARELLKSAGFVGNNDLFINPRRLVMAEQDSAIARLMLDGFSKMVVVPIGFLEHLEEPAAPDQPEEVSGAGNGPSVDGPSVDAGASVDAEPTEAKPRRKKSA